MENNKNENNNEIVTFINFKNNCYFNVILQILINNDKLKNLIFSDLVFLQKRTFETNGIKYINNIYSPKNLLDKLDKLKENFNSRQQNDCIESLEYICDIYKDIETLIYGETINQFKCEKCKKKRFNNEKFLSISVYHNKIEDTFSEMLKKENLELECEYCKENTSTTKCISFKKIGELLILQNILKNQLELNRIINFNNEKYELTGIIKHLGNTRGGHYYYINVVNGFIINDCEIEINNKIDNKNIYLIIYSLKR